jgi:hypothetical protein
MATIESRYSPSRAVGGTALHQGALLNSLVSAKSNGAAAAVNMWATNGAAAAVKVLFSIPWCRRSREGQLRPDLANHIRIFESRERKRITEGHNPDLA